MKKNEGLIVGVIIVVIVVLAVAIRYFFGTGPAEQQPVCPEGTVGAPPDCKPSLDTIFSNSIATAKLKVSNNNTLNSNALLDTRKADIINIIDVDVPKDKWTILGAANKGTNTVDEIDVVELILTDAEKIYLAKFGVVVTLSDASFLIRTRPTGTTPSNTSTYSSGRYRM